ncbi:MULTISPECIES: DUF177 domain-containing protein [Eikenella]|uniref:Large ribosomal RNA subunit accumulation protein YceD n=1 Tax=Eikenella longinqua TaxID=1795827 RepID=A0A1A9RXU6_9NEIS|nr:MULTISPECIES: YceD family protein [Eikenella]OAM28347.1 hypothetical protein A7P95_05135 [Eikenella longinqua]
MSDPILIDPQAVAAQAQHLAGQIRLNEMDERIARHECLAERETPVDFALQGGRDKRERLYLDLSVSAQLSLVCQRCMQPMPFVLDERARIVLFDNETALDEAMAAEEELEGMLLEPELDVGMLVEDQILMTLPYAPCHSDCEHGKLAEINQDRPNPFAALAALKSGR